MMGNKPTAPPAPLPARGAPPPPREYEGQNIKTLPQPVQNELSEAMSKYDYQFELSEASEFDFPPEWTAEPLEGLLSSSLFKGKSWQKDSSDVLGRKRSEHFGSHKSSPDTQDPKVLAIIAKLEECAGKDGTDWYVPKVLGNFLYVDVHFNTFDSDIFFKRK